MRRLALALWNGHRRQPAQALLMLLGLALSVAVVVAIDLSIHSARTAFAQTRQALSGGATHHVHADGEAVPERLLGWLAMQPGVHAAAPVIETSAVEARSGQRLRLLAVDPVAESALRPWTRALAEAGQGAGAGQDDGLATMLGVDDALVMAAPHASSLGLVQGDRITLRNAAGTAEFRVAMLVDAAAWPAGSEGMVLMDIAAGQRLPGYAGALTRIDLVLDRVAVDAVRTALPTGIVLTDSAGRDAALGSMSGAFEVNLQALSLLALLVGVFLVFQTLGFMTLRRRGDIGLLRALGVRRRELAGLLLGEALLLGALAGGAGLLLGSVLAQAMLAAIARTYDDLYYPIGDADLVPSALLLGKAMLLALGGALVAVLVPLRDALRVPPLANLRRLPLEAASAFRAGRGVALSLLLLAVGLALLFRGPTGLVAAFVAIFMMLVASLGVIPALAHVLLRLLQAVSQRRWRVLPGWLVASARQSMSRIGIALAALTLAIATVIGMSTMIHSFRVAVSAWVDDSLRADLFVSGADTLLAPELGEELARIDGVEALSLTRRRQLVVESGPLSVAGVALPMAGRRGYTFLQGEPAAAWRAFERGDALASEPLARRLRLAVGDMLALPTRRGEQALRIAAIYRDYSSSQGVLTLSRERYVQLFDDERVNVFGLYVPASAQVRTEAAVRARFAGNVAIEVISAGEVRERTLAVFQRTFAITDLLRFLAGTIAVVAVLGALLAMQLERAREFALLRAIGIGPATMARLQLAQAGVIGILSGLLAVPVGLALAWTLVHVINARSFGWSMALVVPWWQVGSAIALAVGSALVAGWWPARQLRRGSLATRLREVTL